MVGGRCQLHFIFGESTYPIVPYWDMSQIQSGMTAYCCSFILVADYLLLK